MSAVIDKTHAEIILYELSHIRIAANNVKEEPAKHLTRNITILTDKISILELTLIQLFKEMQPFKI